MRARTSTSTDHDMHPGSHQLQILRIHAYCYVCMDVIRTTLLAYECSSSMYEWLKQISRYLCFCDNCGLSWTRVTAAGWTYFLGSLFSRTLLWCGHGRHGIDNSWKGVHSAYRPDPAALKALDLMRYIYKEHLLYWLWYVVGWSRKDGARKETSTRDYSGLFRRSRRG
jgi:hypothetical protein